MARLYQDEGRAVTEGEGSRQDDMNATRSNCHRKHAGGNFLSVLARRSKEVTLSPSTSASSTLLSSVTTNCEEVLHPAVGWAGLILLMGLFDRGTHGVH